VDRIRSDGYSFAVESLCEVARRTDRLAEFPIHFEDRVAGDSKISKDGGAFANTATPSATTTTVSIALTATEMQCATAQVSVIDQTATKEWEDTVILIRTYGHPSAGIRTGERIGTAQAGAATLAARTRGASLAAQAGAAVLSARARAASLAARTSLTE
jgi:hypothetical protein